MVRTKNLRNALIDDAQAVETGRRLARKVVTWMEFRCGADTELAFSRTAEMFRIDEGSLRSLWRRPQTLKSVSHTTIANLMAAEAYVDRMLGTIEAAEAETAALIGTLTAPARTEAPRPAWARSVASAVEREDA